MPATAVKSAWVGGYQVFYGKDGGVFAHIGAGAASQQLFKRLRVAVADVNAGYELLPALAGFCYQMIYMAEIAYGGAATTVTTVDILGTQTSSVKLMAGAQASLTRSTLIYAGGTGGAILADGASFMPCDVNTAITCNVTGAGITVATGIDFLLEFFILAG